MRSLASISEPRDDKVEKEVGLLMAIALGELTRRAQFHLGDLDQEVWSKELLQSFLSEGLRRLAPVLLREGATSVDITSSASVIALPSSDLIVYVLRAWSSTEELPAWRHFHDELRLSSPVSQALTIEVEYLGGWQDFSDGTCELAPWQSDSIVFYAVSRAFREMARNRADFRRYSTITNQQVEQADIERLADVWEKDFERARQEARHPRQLHYEQATLERG